MRRTSEADRARLQETFAALCAIRSPTGEERACADRVTAELEALGLSVEEDAGPPGSRTGNLLARIAPTGGMAASVLLCTHLDTVPPAAPIEPVLQNGFWENAHEGILGADNKAAVAVALELARLLTARARAGGAAPGLELLFTVAEETGLQGARAFDVARLRSPHGYVLDHASPIGEIITSSPTHHQVVAEFRGQAAHAGLCPEKGRSAILAASRAIAGMTLGRLDEHTTANVGVITGGSAGNVVPERCRVEAEVRSADAERAEALVAELIDHLGDGAGAVSCDVDVTAERMFQGYRTGRGEPGVLLAEQALQRAGYTPRAVASGGGSDANALRAAGFPCVNLANGTERAHEPGERVALDALEGMLEVMLELVQLAGEAAPAAPGPEVAGAPNAGTPGG